MNTSKLSGLSFKPQKIAAILMIAVAAAALVSLSRGYAAGKRDYPPKDIVLVVDSSASVGVLNADVINDAINSTLCPGCRLGVIGFGSTVTTVVDLKPLKDWGEADFEKFDSAEMRKRSQALGTGSSFVTVLKAATDMLAGAGSPGEGRIVLLTDGSTLNNGETRSLDALKSELAESIEPRLKVEGIKLYTIIIDRQKIDDSDYEMWRRFAQQNGGETIKTGSDGDIKEKLSSRFVMGDDQHPLVAGPNCLYSLMVEPYQHAISMALAFKASGLTPIAATVTDPQGNVIPLQPQRVNGGEGRIVYTNHASPAAGEWKLCVSGEGRIGYFDASTEPRNLALLKVGTLPPAMQAGAQVQVHLALRDQGDPAFPTPQDKSDFVAEVLLIGQGATGAITHVVKAETANGFVFTATLPDNRSSAFEGEYRVLARATSKTHDPLQEVDLGTISWAQVPHLDGAAPALSPSAIRQNQPFTVSARVLNTDVLVGDPRVEFIIRASGGISATLRDATCARKSDATICSAMSAGMADAGAYAVEATLAGGSTKHGLSFDSASSPPTPFTVRPMTMWEELQYDPARFLAHYWPWLAGVLFLIAAVVSAIYMGRNWDLVRLRWLLPADATGRLKLYRAVRARGRG